MTRKAFIWASLSLLILMTFLPSCKAEKPILIGYVGSMTGQFSSLGLDGRNGAEIAVEEINAAGGIHGRLLVLQPMDDTNDGNTAVGCIDTLIRDGATAIVGPMTSSMAESIVPYINEKEILTISPTVAAPEHFGKDDYFFSMISPNTSHAKAIADRMIADGISKAAVLYDTENYSYSKSLTDVFLSEYAKEGNDSTLTIPISEGSSNSFACELQQLQDSRIEGIFLIASGHTAARFFQRKAIWGLDAKVYLPMWPQTSEMLQEAGVTAEGAVCVNSFNPRSKSTKYVSFRKAFADRYSAEPTFAACFAYEGVMVLAEAMRTNKAYTSESIKTSIISIGRFDGLQESFQFNTLGDIDRHLFFQIIRKGQYEPEE